MSEKSIVSEELTNDCDDIYIKKEMNYSKDKKRNMELWDEVEGVAEEAIIKFAEFAGVKVLNLGDPYDVKQVTELLIKIVKERFDAEILYVDEEY